MTINIPDDLADSVRNEVLSGHFASEDEFVAAVLRDYLRRQEEPKSPAAEAAGVDPYLELQQRLVAAGVLSEVKPRITDHEPYKNRRAYPIQGEPLSETIIRERR